MRNIVVSWRTPRENSGLRTPQHHISDVSDDMPSTSATASPFIRHQTGRGGERGSLVAAINSDTNQQLVAPNKGKLNTLYHTVIKATLFGFGAVTSFWLGTGLVSLAFLSWLSLVAAVGFWVIAKLSSIGAGCFHSAASIYVAVGMGVDALAGTFHALSGSLFTLGFIALAFTVAAIIIVFAASLGLNFFAHGKRREIIIEEMEDTDSAISEEDWSRRLDED
ncbi:hypothetical protein PROFUN_07479 [Planoprotostelium fungivorum]|uniref:Uncharacterized protein n=1 Tax=Planoprotostelium fungivorum TaxID=1890364 RepID=A0A2P6NLH2_9EUKA|nr:hypothetical protein PROFUN_07479 [Planoprotostelium fungivorum]